MLTGSSAFDAIEGCVKLTLAAHAMTVSANEVIWRRMSMLSRGAMSGAEMIAMVMEKPAAFAASAERALVAVARGGDALKVATAALGPYGRKAAANARRLRK